MTSDEGEGRNSGSLRRGNSLRLPSRDCFKEGELIRNSRTGGSLRIPRKSERLEEDNLLSIFGSPNGRQRSIRHTRHSAPSILPPAPEFLARNLLQLGCPVVVYIPKPRAGVGTEPLPSSDSDDSTTMQSHHGGHLQGQGQGRGHIQLDGSGVPMVHVSGPQDSSDPEPIIDGWSAGSIGARSAPSTPFQSNVVGSPPTGQIPVSGAQLTATGNIPLPPKSPSHSLLKSSENQLSKPLSKSTPSMAVGGIQTSVSRTSSKSSPGISTSSARQKKFHRHFSQVAADERVLNYYSCALVGDILLQGHLYITPNYFAFYSNVFGYITKLLIPTISVVKITKEKTARIIPNAVAVSTEEDRHVFCSLLSRDTTYKLMIEVWEAAMESRSVVDVLPLPVAENLVSPSALLVDESEINPEEDDSSMSESGTDLTSRPPTVCTDTDGHSPSIPSVSLQRLEQELFEKTKHFRPAAKSSVKSMLWGGFNPGTIIAILVALLAALYVSAALMMFRIDKLHTAYINHPLATPARFTQDRLLQYLNTNLDQIVKVRQSLQTLSQQIVSLSHGSENEASVTGGSIEPEESPS